MFKWREYLLVFLLSLIAAATEANAARQLVWYQYGIASATGGFDLENNRTLVNRWYLVAYGPDRVDREVKAYVQDCAKTATISGAEAFKDTPSPELSARVAAAWAAFQTSVQGCLSLRSAAKAYASKFEIGYIRRAFWIDGLALKFDAESQTARNYRKLHNAVKDELPEPVNKLIVLYTESQDYPSIDIRFTLPKEGTRFLAQLPDPQRLKQMQEQFEAAGEKYGKKLLAEVKREAAQGVQSAKEAIENLGRSGGEYMQQAAAASIKFSEDSLKEANRIIASYQQGGVPLLAPTVPGFIGIRQVGREIRVLDLSGARIVPGDIGRPISVPGVDDDELSIPLVPSVPLGPKIKIKSPF